MILSRLELIYNKIDSLSPTVKTILIIVLTVLISELGFRKHSLLILEDYTEQVLKDKYLAEEYTKIVTPYINNQIGNILALDKDASNVILLNYHNTLVSTHGLSYRYLTSLTEKKRGINTRSCKTIWKELEYTYYGEELERINDNKFLRMDSISHYLKSLPNLVELLSLSNAVSAAFYPIKGINSPIAMLVIIYPKKKEYELGYYMKTISPYILPLVTILDYNSVKEEFEDLYKSGNKTIPESLLRTE